MTPTATKTKPSAAKRKRELQQALEAATAERDETANRAAQHRRRINELKDFLAQRHTGHPQDFTESGVPEPDTKAAELAAEIAELERADRYADAINGAQGRIDLAERDLRRHRAEHTRDLLAEMEPEAQEAVDRWMAWAAEGQTHHRELIELSTHATALVVAANLYGSNSQATCPDYEHRWDSACEVERSRRGSQPAPAPAARRSGRARGADREGDE
jgi:hypothetical protein